MNMVTHILKKDVRRTRVLLGVWLLLVVLQFVLIGAGVNPGDRVTQALYQTLAVLVPLFQALVLIVVIPHVMQDEPLVGTTAFWFTRPISRGTLLKSKALFAFLVLALPPLVVELIVMAANGATGRDLGLATPEILMGQLSLILTVGVLAAVTANFGRFAILGAVVVVTSILIGLAIFWIGLYLHPESILDQATHMSLTKSRSVVESLLMIVCAGGLIAHQALTRKTGRTYAGMAVALVLILLTSNYWRWDFLTGPPPAGTDPNFNAASVKVSLTGYVESSDVVNFRGQGSPDKSISAHLDTAEVPKGYVLEAKDMSVRLTGTDGTAVNVKPRQSYLAGLMPERNGDALEAALGGTPVVNASNYSYINQSNVPLFTLDADTYAKYAPEKLAFGATVHFEASKYVVAGEMPLTRGARYDHGSDHLVITDVLHEPGGLEILMRERKFHLLFDRHEEVNPQLARTNVVYLLWNKKRGEAVMQKQNDSMSFNIMAGSARLVNEPVRVTFGRESDSPMPDLTPEWVADATLVRLELEPAADFTKELNVPQFPLMGLLGWQNTHTAVVADPGELAKITLPANATEPQVRSYIDAIMVASRKQTSWSDRDPQVGMLAAVGEQNIGVLADYASYYQSTGAGTYFTDAIKQVAGPGDAAEVLKALPLDHDLVSLVVKYEWEPQAKDTLVTVLGQKNRYLPDDWIKAVAALQDPATYPDLKSYLAVCDSPQKTYDAIKQLPGLDLSDTVDGMWSKARYGKPYEMLKVCSMAAEHGHADAIAKAAELIKTDKNARQVKRAREIVTKFTPATGDDAALVGWVEGNQGKLVFDKGTGKFGVGP